MAGASRLQSCVLRGAGVVLFYWLCQSAITMQIFISMSMS